MLIAKTGIKYNGKRIPKGTEITKGMIDDKILKALLADGAVEDTSIAEAKVEAKAKAEAKAKKEKEEAKKERKKGKK